MNWNKVEEKLPECWSQISDEYKTSDNGYIPKETKQKVVDLINPPTKWYTNLFNLFKI